MSFFSKINIWNILKNHFNTLVNHNTNKPGGSDYIIFLIIPLVCASIFIGFNIFLSDSAINILITTMTVLVGLLFNVLVILFDIIRRNSENVILKQILKEVLSNISYTVFVSIVIIVFTLATNFTNVFVKTATTWVVYFLLVNFILTVVMILKRIFRLFENELNNS